MADDRAPPALTAVVPTLDAADVLGPCLSALRRWPELEVIVADGGSADSTEAVAAGHGATVIVAERGRGSQLRAGAAAATGTWLMFLHADTILSPDWPDSVRAFLTMPEADERVGVFRFALDDPAMAARRLERVVAWRTRALGLPYGDQGLLVSRAFYVALGGHPGIPLMEDVALIRRVGRRRIVRLDAVATTSAARYRRGYLRRSARNLVCLALYYAGVPPRTLLRLYR